MPATEFVDANAAYGFGAAATMVQVLKQCGNDLSRDNIMKQAANIKDFELPLLLPGMRSTPRRPTTPHPSDAADEVQRRELGAIGEFAGRLNAMGWPAFVLLVLLAERR